MPLAHCFDWINCIAREALGSVRSCKGRFSRAHAQGIFAGQRQGCCHAIRYDACLRHPVRAGQPGGGQARGAAAHQVPRHRGALPVRGAVCGGALVAAALAMARLRRSLCRGGHHRRPRRLVCGGGAVQAAARPAHSAHRDHPGQPEPHRRQSRPLHRGQFPGARTGSRQARRGRFRRTRRRLAGRSRSGQGASPVSSAGWCRRRCRRSRAPACATSSPSACSTSSERCAWRRWRPNCSPPSPTTAATRSCSTD